MAKFQRRNDSNTGRSQRTKGERRGDYRDKMSQRSRENNPRKARNGTQVKEGYGNVIPLNDRHVFKPLNDRQRIFASLIRSSTCTMALGVAGAGKSHVAINVAVEMLLAGLIDMIVCLKPATEIDSELGILPGDKDEKLAVLYNPMKQLFIKLLGKSRFENECELGKILFEPLGSILGMTYDNAVMIVDEAQYTTPGQMKIILTRLGRDTKIVLCGDYKEQRFEEGMSGLEDAYNRLGQVHGVGVVNFELEDIVRSGFTRTAIEAYRKN